MLELKWVHASKSGRVYAYQNELLYTGGLGIQFDCLFSATQIEKQTYLYMT